MTISVRGGCFSYKPKSGKNVLTDLNLAVEKGEILAILGPNGAGKTTLLRCIMGFLRWTSGGSYLDGRELRTIPANLLWRKIAYVPQARGKASPSPVENMVMLGRSSRIGLFRNPGREDAAAVAAVLDKLGLAPLRKRRCDEISGGELQMVLIARALAAEPECVILDEPESNLDFKNQLIVLQTIQNLRDEGISCIFNTHYPAHALRYADKAMILDKSGKYLFGGASETVTQRNIAAAFGVESMIEEFETGHHVYREITAISILKDAPELTPSAPASDAPAVIGIIVGREGDVEQVNEILHRSSEHIIGRFGMPFARKDTRIITVVLDAPESVVRDLSERLNAVRGISVKATFALDTAGEHLRTEPDPQ